VSRDSYARARRVAVRRLAFFAALLRGRSDTRRIWPSAAIARKLERLVRAARAAVSRWVRSLGLRRQAHTRANEVAWRCSLR
jgi:hypothetical protein